MEKEYNPPQFRSLSANPTLLTGIAPEGALRMAEEKARPAGLEPATDGLENRCSIRLSYGREN